VIETTDKRYIVLVLFWSHNSHKNNIPHWSSQLWGIKKCDQMRYIQKYIGAIFLRENALWGWRNLERRRYESRSISVYLCGCRNRFADSLRRASARC
jgi:hypothetical protein